GVGKSSLINRIFGINIAVRRCREAGYLDIEREFQSEENGLLVLHDSEGFEPGQLENYITVRRFIEERSMKPLLKDRIHCLWLCVETPIAGGRVLETGDEKLIEFAHEKDSMFSTLRKGYEEQLSNLAEITEDVCKSRVKGDAWLLWSMAQRASLLIKIDACITVGCARLNNRFSDHIQAAVSSIFGQSRLRDCLEKVHKDIITCWNFKDEGEVVNC
ncbi:hypothetical protein EI94DRAFT_1579910, partial [Lactarius quietus]